MIIINKKVHHLYSGVSSSEIKDSMKCFNFIQVGPRSTCRFGIRTHTAVTNFTVMATVTFRRPPAYTTSSVPRGVPSAACASRSRKYSSGAGHNSRTRTSFTAVPTGLLSFLSLLLEINPNQFLTDFKLQELLDGDAFLFSKELNNTYFWILV